MAGASSGDVDLPQLDGAGPSASLMPEPIAPEAVAESATAEARLQAREAVREQVAFETAVLPAVVESAASSLSPAPSQSPDSPPPPVSPQSPVPSPSSEAAGAWGHPGSKVAVTTAAEPSDGFADGGRSAPRWVEPVASALLMVFAVYSVWLPYLPVRTSVAAVLGARVAAIVAGLVLLRWSSRRGGLPVVVFVVFLAVWMATSPWWTAWDTKPARVTRNHSVAVGNALVALGCLGVAGGRLDTVRAVRRMWLAVVLATVPVGVWEVVTGHHLVPAQFWKAPERAPAAVFGNPNNFAVVLTVGVGVGLIMATERTSTWVRRVAWGALASTCLVLIPFTNGRAAEASCVLLVVMAGVAWIARRGVSLRAAVRRRPRLVGGAGIAVVTLFVASVTVPSVAAVNPVLRVVAPADDVTARSDSLRVALVRTGLRWWQESPWTGIGIARFDALARRGHPEFGGISSMHNGIAQMLVEFGLIMFVPFVLAVMVALWRAVRPTPGRRPAVDTVTARCLLLTYLLAFVQAGVVVSSSVPWSVWWMLLAGAASTAWWLGAVTPARRRGQETPTS